MSLLNDIGAVSKCQLFIKKQKCISTRSIYIYIYIYIYIKDFLQTQQAGSLFNTFNVPNEDKVKRYENIGNLRNKFKILPCQI